MRWIRAEKLVGFPKSGSNIVTVREDNMSLVIRLIHKAKICSRADIAIATGLKQATITNIVNDLIQWGLVMETGNIEGRMKRRSIGITINNNKYRLLGVQLSRDFIETGIFDAESNILERKSVPITFMTSPEEVVSMMKAQLRDMITLIKDSEILGIGVALPGPFVAGEGRIALMSGFPGWELIHLKQILESSFNLPVFLEHDANCSALAEWLYGEIGDNDNLLTVLVDGGVGSGIIVNGELYHGRTGTAGEIGHASIDYSGPKCECGNRGCLELYCSTVALRQFYRADMLAFDKDTASPSSLEIIDAVRKGDEQARRVFTKTATYLAIGLVNAINTLNPGLTVISGSISLAGDYLIDVLKAVLKKRLIKDIYQNLEIKLGTFGIDSALVGASALVLEETLKQPSRYFRPTQEEDR